ncbi:hypothetical protein DU500_03185 [Haloplanus rubicundus]|uniref:Uncharacterized protein n=1 Tax=Haloplanus rubicundus TaxID=1547898 RepID=A0A345EHP5_9EURY|nr:hypothetical protein [Haloplanus rubicundus]AXG08019.1 hypothetical protein DU500_03185 [Haloplanus rubicundus]AXG11717.1 hypothetical protein DU484_02780 [Haloplanus rubicundus]
MTGHRPTRRRLLRYGAALGVGGVALTTSAAANPGKGDERGNGKTFGRVYANDVLWRTHVVKILDDRPDPEDKIYFLHDGSGPIVDNPDASDDQASPFVSESAPGDRDWNGGKWTHFSAEVTDLDAFNEDAPLTNVDDVLDADYVEVTLGRPGFGPPDFFICPLNGRA